MKKLCAAVLAAVMLCLCGCSVVGDIAGNVANAAVEELEKQVRQTLQTYKVDVVEVKAAMGNLNSENSSARQLFCAVLLKTDSETSLQTCVSALDKVFAEAGSMTQTGNRVEHPYLVHKQIEYKYTGFADGQTYYTVYGYAPDVSLKLPDLSGMIPTGAVEP